MKLICDVRSGSNTRRVYGLMGANVKLISDCGNVLIVEGEDGVRFPTLKNNVTDGPLNIIPKPAAPSTADTASDQPIINKRVPVQKKAALIKQPTLF